MEKHEDKQEHYEDKRVNLAVVNGEPEHRHNKQDEGQVQLDGDAVCGPYFNRSFHTKMEGKVRL